MTGEKYITIKELAKLKGVSTRAIRLSKGKYQTRDVSVKGGKSFEILLSSIEPELQEKYYSKFVPSCTEKQLPAQGIAFNAVGRNAIISDPDWQNGAYEDLNSFKLFVLDVGLLGALVNLDAKTILDRYEIFQEFKGAMAEQYVLQQFKTIKDLPVYYWTNETSRSEVDFVIQVDSKVVPVEVKAATNLKARSLKIYMEQFKPELALRTSLADYKKTENLIDLPLYTVERL